MDDLASLFLPDLLHPLSGLPSRKQSDAFLFHSRSNISTPLSSGLGMFMALTDERDLAPTDSSATTFPNGSVPPNSGDVGPSAPAPAALGQTYQGTFVPNATNAIPMGYHSQTPYNPTFPNTPMGLHNNFQNHCFGMLPDQDYGHTLHYADFVPAAAGFQQPLRHHQRAQMLPVQPAFSLSTVIGQFDSMGWPLTDDLAPMSLIAFGNATPETMAPVPPGMGSVTPVSKPETAEVAPHKEKQKKLLTTDKSKGDGDIHMDYSSEALDQLLQLAPTVNLAHQLVQLTDSGGNPVTTTFTGSLNGRLLTNDHDNYNHICAYTGTPDPNEVYSPRVISCYRRNFVSIHLRFALNNFPTPLFLRGEPVTRFRIKIGAVAEGKDQNEVLFMIINDKEKSTKEKFKRERNRPSAGEINLVDKVTAVELQDCDLENNFWIKKLQFKSATSNSASLNFQTYYRITASIVAETESSVGVLHDLMGACMTVRGRNPTFFQDRKDFRIKTGPHLGSEVSSITKQQLELAEGSVGQELLRVKEEEVDDVQPEKDVDSNQEKESRDSIAASDVEGEAANQSDVQPPSRAAQAELPKVASVSEFIASKIQDGEKNYHYFPILSVYYLPPINVVYFPHGAHQDTSGGDGNTSRDGENTVNVPNDPGKKRTSKVYFR